MLHTERIQTKKLKARSWVSFKTFIVSYINSLPILKLMNLLFIYNLKGSKVVITLEPLFLLNQALFKTRIEIFVLSQFMSRAPRKLGLLLSNLSFSHTSNIYRNPLFLY